LPESVAILEVRVLAFVPAQIVQPFTDARNAAAPEFWREETEKPKPGHPCGLLSLGGHRRRKHRCKASYKSAPVHYSRT
jgi:hypothetical protein